MGLMREERRGPGAVSPGSPAAAGALRAIILGEIKSGDEMGGKKRNQHLSSPITCPASDHPPLYSRTRTLLYAVRGSIQNGHFLAFMSGQNFAIYVSTRIRPHVFLANFVRMRYRTYFLVKSVRMADRTSKHESLREHSGYLGTIPYSGSTSESLWALAHFVKCQPGYIVTESDTES